MPSYEQSKTSKLWSVRFREIDELGETHQKRLSGFKTKKDARYGYEDYVMQRAAEEDARKNLPKVTPDDMYFEVLTEQFLKYKEDRVKHSSYYDTKSRISSKILPYFTGKKMKDIKPLDILDWQKKTFPELSYNYTSKLMAALGAIFAYGEKYHDITNIMNKVDRPRNMSPKKEMQFWTPDEFGKFYTCADDPTYRLFFLTLYITGCRRGECEALTWSDFDNKAAKIKISKSITNKTPGKAWEITTPKNAGSNRTVTIPSFLCDMLHEYKKTQSTQNTDFTDKAFIFGGNRPLASTSTDRYFKKTIAKAEVKPIRIHDLRHSCASLLISKGVSIVGVSRRLGHVDVEQTLNTYAHLMPDDQTKINTELENIGSAISLII